MIIKAVGDYFYVYIFFNFESSQCIGIIIKSASLFKILFLKNWLLIYHIYYQGKGKCIVQYMDVSEK